MSLKEITRYIVENQPNDYLLMGFPSDKQNPYREKSSCQLLWEGPHLSPNIPHCSPYCDTQYQVMFFYVIGVNKVNRIIQGA